MTAVAGTRRRSASVVMLILVAALVPLSTIVTSVPRLRRTPWFIEPMPTTDKLHQSRTGSRLRINASCQKRESGTDTEDRSHPSI